MQAVRAFLCHSSSDKEIVIRVKKDLDKREILTWLDEFQIGIGESIRREIEQGIASSNFLILFMSKASLKSEWVNREIDAAFMREVESKDTTIIPILLEDCEIPASLKPKRYIDLRQDYEKGISALIDSLVYPRRSVLRALVGRWVGASGALYLSSVGNLVIGKYDWADQKSGNILGHVEKNRIKFNWTWDHSTERGMGMFDLDGTLQKLEGGWWLSTADIDPDLSCEELVHIEGFNPWNFEKDQGSKKGRVYLHDRMCDLLDAIADGVNPSDLARDIYPGLIAEKGLLAKAVRLPLSGATSDAESIFSCYAAGSSVWRDYRKLLQEAQNERTQKKRKKSKKRISNRQKKPKTKK